MRTLLIILLATGWLLTGCSDNPEMELKQNYTYQSASLKVKNKRVFTMHGEITDPTILNSIVNKIKNENPMLEFPVNKKLTNQQKVKLRFSGNDATFSSGIN